MPSPIHIPPPRTPSYHAAVLYLARGLRVLPIWWTRDDGTCACGNVACPDVGKHPVALGSTGASDSAEQVLRWWTSYPNANPAIGTGAGLIVIDLDDKVSEGKDGLGNWQRLVLANGGVPDTVTTITPSGGRHLYFATVDHVPSSQSRPALGAGIDVRGHHGYIIAPPSRHRNGGTYRWEPGRALDEIAIAPAPRWLIDRAQGVAAVAPVLSGPEDAREQIGSLVPLELRIPPGTRHARFLSLAGVLRNRGLREPELLAVLREVNARRCVPRHDDQDTLRIAQDAARWSVRADRLPPLPELLEPPVQQQLRALKSVARTMWRHGLGQFEIAAGLATINALRGRPPMSDEFLIEVINLTAPT